MAAAQGMVDVGVVAGVAGDVVEPGRDEGRREVARGGALVLVVDDGRDVADVVVDGVAEEEKLHHGQRDHHPHGEAIAFQLQELLAGDDERT